MLPPMPDAPNNATGELRAVAEAILVDARAAVAAGREPELDVLRARLRAAAERARQTGDGGETIDRAEQQTLQQLEQVVTVQRARIRLATRPTSPGPRSTGSRRPALRTRPTISANMELRRERDGDSFRLAWDAAPIVASWEVRLSERPDARADYVVRDTLTLPAEATGVDLPLGDVPLRVHVLGRSRDGRLLRRAVISSLTRESWDERWQRRASAS